jgi:ABC-type antimicrobial peptide transport system permease subunit
MKNMGLNQITFHKSQPALDLFLCADKQVEFSDKITERLASHTELLSKYYLSMLQRKIDVKGGQLILTGISPVERPDETEEKGNPVKAIKSGYARLGFSAALLLNAKRDESIKIKSREFKVESIIREEGTIDDFRVFLNLADAQKLLGKQGKINAILSFECLHAGGSLESIHEYQKKNFDKIAPEFKQLNFTRIAQGRYYSRQMTENYQYYLLGIVGLITILIVVITGLQEVVDRKYETGILIAQGAGYFYIMGLYIFKTLILLFAAALTGVIIGGFLSVWLTTPFLTVGTKNVAIQWGLLFPAVLLICGVGIIAEFIPMIKLLRMDPCAVIMEE